MPSARLLLRWSWRDLRHRWLQVGAIALLLAIGLGMHAGLGSTATWRYASNDASYDLLAMHDLRVELAPGSQAQKGTLAAVASGLGTDVEAVEERLILPTQVRLSVGDDEILARGRLVGVDVTAGEPAVNRVHVYEGRELDPDDDGRPIVLLERGFAAHHGLPEQGELDLGGGLQVDYVGHATAPEYFFVMGEGVELFAQASYAVLFTPLGSLQAVAGPVVNDLVVRLAPSADVEAARRQLTAALAAELPDISATVTTRAEDPAYHVLYEDIDNDQKVWNVIAFLILGGATLAAFNLASRIIEAQRREIGMGMALGVTPRMLAVRPLLFGAQIGLLGVLGGIGVGFAVTAAMRGLFIDFLPLPVWITDFQPGMFARAAVVGLVLPLFAVAYPVWRAVRVEPVEAMRHVATRHGGASGLGARMPLPGRTIAQVPLRNLLRNPRRSLITAIAVGAALTTLVALVGTLDSFDRTLGDYGTELAGDHPDRVTLTLAGFVPIDGAELAQVASRTGVARVEPSIQLPATVMADGEELPVLVDLVDGRAGLWAPSVEEGGLPTSDGLVITRKAAEDLGVGVGDTVVLRHPQRHGEAAFRMVDAPVTVAGIHPGPFRPNAYLASDAAERFGLTGMANIAHVAPEAGVDAEALRRELFEAPGVATVTPTAGVVESLQETMELFEGVLRIGMLAVLALALLIAFNTASISADERAREHATMLAFGLPTRRVLRMLTVESAALGVVGTALGLAAGLGVLDWMLGTVMTETMPEFGMRAYLAPASVGTVLVLGVLSVALAPLLTVRKLLRMDIPATLRVYE